MAKGKDGPIPSMDTSWEQYKGSAVEQFIKDKLNSKAGFIKVVPSLDGTQNILMTFKDEETYNDWRSLDENQRWSDVGLAMVVSYDTLPSIEQRDVYAVTLSFQEVPEQTQPDANVTVNIKAASTVTYASGEEEPISETITIELQSRTSATGSYVPRATFEIPSNSAVWEAIDLAPYLSAGYNYIRMRAVGEYASSIWRTLTLNVVALSITPNTTFEVPMQTQLSINYLIGGVIAKVIQFEFGTGVGSAFERQYSYLSNDPECSQNLGTSTNLQTGMTFTFHDANMLAVLMAPGAHTVRARLFVSETVKTDWVESQYMVAAAGQKLVIVNDVNPVLDNWADVSFFKWAASTGGAGTMPVVFILRDSATDAVLASWTANAQDDTEYELATQLGVELSDPTITEFYGYMHIEDGEGNALATPIFFTFKNDAAFSPVTGADFILQPSVRSNSEDNPKTIINAATGLPVTSIWDGFGMVSDGWMDVPRVINSAYTDTVKALHIPAGRKLTIGYNPFTDFMSGNNTGKNVTIELDFRTNSILDEEEAIFQICSTFSADGKAWGFEMLPKEAYMLTQRKRAVDDQNVTWAEGVRTHMAINVVYGLRGLNYVRIFIDGGIEREFNYAINDVFVGENVSMVIGNNHSDIDIFSIRVYKKALSTDEVMQDRKAAFSTVAEKLSFAEDNDIMGDNGAIDFNKAKAKYNVIGLTGHLAKYGDENKGKTKHNSLYISQVGDIDHSGTLTELENSGQGTTAMTYDDWNQQQKISDDSMFIPDSDPMNPVSASGGWSPFPGEAKCKKFCGKINFASSMQGHKMGLTRVYTEIFKQLVATSAISEPGQITIKPEARLAVYERPFLFFHRETENDPWVFKYLMTWGAGKGDKPTFGYSNSATNHMIMVEGANNDRPLALFRVPWNDDITYDPAEEAWMYNNQKQINFGFGHTATTAGGDEYPDDAPAIDAIKAFFNFNYLHHQRVTYFAGTLTELRNSQSVNQSLFYWVTQSDSELSSNRYDLYRYDELTQNWVDAGLDRVASGRYSKLNVRDQYESFGGQATWTAGQWDNINNLIINQRTVHFKANAATVMHVDDCLYHSCFVKFFAGTDNRAKNTYYYTDPVTLKVRHMQDDVDTVIKTNNVGQNRKPYYVEEHDQNASGEYYWQGEESGYYNLLETAFETEMSAMMNNFLTAMATISGTVMDYLVSRVLEAQDYFPKIAYNEMARLVYEQAAIDQAAGVYVNTSVQAITQSVGAQRWSEYDWLKDRSMYISSWCEYGEFAGSSAAANGLSWRGKNGAVYNFKLTPAKWLYPRVGSDSGNYPASANGKRVRVPAGTQMSYPAITLSSDSWISIRGINYFLDIGDFNVGVSADQGTFAFYGKLLQQITVNPNGTDENLLLANAIAIANATNIKKIVIRGVTTIRSELDLTQCARLEEIDLRGSNFPIVELPGSEKLTTIHFPSTLTTLKIDAQPSLELVDFEGVDHLSNIYVDQSMAGSFSTSTLANDIYLSKLTSGGTLASATFLNVTWTGISAAMLNYYAQSDVSVITGTVAIAGDSTQVTFDMKRLFLDKWGAVDSQDNDLYITYTAYNIVNALIEGEDGVAYIGDYAYDVTPATAGSVAIDYGNNFKEIRWSVPANIYCTIDSATGQLHVTQVGTENPDGTGPNVTITVQVTKLDNTIITATKTIRMYLRSARLGDNVFADGTYSDQYDGTKSVVGICFYLNGTNRLMVATKNAFTEGVRWGLFNHPSYPDESIPDLVDAYNTSYSWYDTPVENRTSSGIVATAEGGTDGYISDATYRDASQSDGFRVLASGSACATIGLTRLTQDLGDYFHAGDYINWGQYYTLQLIIHRDRILSQTGDEIPAASADETETQALTRCRLAIRQKAQNDGISNYVQYDQFYYPAASYCFAYEPEVTTRETLIDKFKAHNWWLPSAGENARLYWYHSKGYDGVDENAIFSNAYANHTFTQFSGGTYWCSSASNPTSSWYIYFTNGYVYSNYKFISTYVRAVAAF